MANQRQGFLTNFFVEPTILKQVYYCLFLALIKDKYGQAMKISPSLPLGQVGRKGRGSTSTSLFLSKRYLKKGDRGSYMTLVTQISLSKRLKISSPPMITEGLENKPSSIIFFQLEHTSDSKTRWCFGTSRTITLSAGSGRCFMCKNNLKINEKLARLFYAIFSPRSHQSITNID